MDVFGVMCRTIIQGSMKITMLGNNDAHPNLDEHCRTKGEDWIVTSVGYRQMTVGRD